MSDDEDIARFAYYLLFQYVYSNLHPERSLSVSKMPNRNVK
jgi:hypothetical protein